MIKLEIVDDKEKANLAETEWIALLRGAGFDLINLNPGGGSGPLSLETRQKMSAMRKGTRPSALCVETAARSNRGKKRPQRSPEWLEAMAAAQIGKKHSLEHREAISRAGKGRKQSPEHVSKRVASRAATLLARKQ